MGETFLVNRKNRYSKINFNNYIPKSSYVSCSTFTKQLSLPRRLSRLAAASDHNGNVLFGGGFGNTVFIGGSYYSAYVDKFTTSEIRTSLPDLTTGRSNLAAEADGDGKILFGGGSSSSSVNSNEVELYSIEGSKSSLDGLSTGRRLLAASTNKNGEVLFGGGRSGTYSAEVEKYTVSGFKSILPSLSTARDTLAASADGKGNILFGGGSNSSVIDKYSNEGTKTTLSTDNAYGYSAAATDGKGNVLFGGGYSGSTYQSAVFGYDVDGVRTTLSNLDVGRRDLAAATDGRGSVVFGGGIAATYCANVEKYDIHGVKSTLDNLSLARYNLAAVTDGKGDILFGGGNNAPPIEPVNRIDKYLNKYIMVLPITLGSKYKFDEDTEEKVVETNELVVEAPLTGYIKIKRGTIN